MWSLSLTRAGRERGFSLSTSGISPDFRAASGFISRGGIATVSLTPRLTRFGAPGAAI